MDTMRPCYGHGDVLGIHNQLHIHNMVSSRLDIEEGAVSVSVVPYTGLNGNC